MSTKSGDSFFDFEKRVRDLLLLTPSSCAPAEKKVSE